MSLQKLSIAFKIFFFFGICPFNFNQKKFYITPQSIIYQKIYLILTIICVIKFWLWALTFLMALKLDSKLWNLLYNSNINKYADFISITNTMLTFCILIINIHRNKRKHVSFLNKFNLMNNLLNALISPKLVTNLTTNFVRKLFIFTAIEIISIILIKFNEKILCVDISEVVRNLTIIFKFLQLTTIILTAAYIHQLAMLLINYCNNLLNVCKNKNDFKLLFSRIDLFEQIKLEFYDLFSDNVRTIFWYNFVTITVSLFSTFIIFLSREFIAFDLQKTFNSALIQIIVIVVIFGVFDNLGKQVSHFDI